MGFRDLHVVREMFAELDGYAQLEQRCFEVHQWRMRQQRDRRGTAAPKERGCSRAYQREWQARKRATPEGRAAKQAANTSHYGRLKADDAKWRKHLKRIAAWKAAKRAERRAA